MEKPLVGFRGSVASVGKEEGCNCPGLSSTCSSTWSAEGNDSGRSVAKEGEGQFAERSSLL